MGNYFSVPLHGPLLFTRLKLATICHMMLECLWMFCALSVSFPGNCKYKYTELLGCLYFSLEIESLHTSVDLVQWGFLLVKLIVTR